MKKKKRYKTPPQTHSKASEPGASYIKDEIRVFQSFKEMEEADAKEMAKFSPVEHFQHITEYIKHVYANELKHKMKDLTIHFKNTEDGNTAS